MKVSSSFGRRLARLRHQKGYSQEAMAERAGLSRNFIVLLETGKRQPSLDTAIRIAEALEMKLNDLAGAADGSAGLGISGTVGVYRSDPEPTKEGRKLQRLIKRLASWPEEDLDVLLKAVLQIEKLHGQKSKG